MTCTAISALSGAGSVRESDPSGAAIVSTWETDPVIVSHHSTRYVPGARRNDIFAAAGGGSVPLAALCQVNSALRIQREARFVVGFLWPRTRIVVLEVTAPASMYPPAARGMLARKA